VVSLAAEEVHAPRSHISDSERQKLIEDHVGLVHYVVGRIALRLPDGVDREDLESAGIVGLIKAADRYDPARQVKFATYASAVIRGEIMEALRAKDWAPRSLRRRYRQLEETIAHLQAQLQRQPTEAEIRRELGLGETEYRQLLWETSGMAVSSLEELMELTDSAHGEESFVEPAGTAEDPAQVVDEQALAQLLAEAVEQLPERDRTVIGLYYQDELTLREIGEVLDVTESRVCQIHTQAITRLRSSLRNKLQG
jgi:RNA polymerase sigma factor for flagellar operon FliA